MIALIIGTLAVLAALAFVLTPLFTDPERPSGATPSAARGSSPREQAVAALREIEFDRATGKLSESDYQALTERYTALAVLALREEERAGPADATGTAVAGAVEDDALERLIGRYRALPPACPTCGPRPEPDARYCSSCGSFLAGRCAHCGAAVQEREARFCNACGTTLAA